MSLAVSKLEGVLRAFRLLPKLPVLPEVRPLPHPRSLLDPLGPGGPRVGAGLCVRLWAVCRRHGGAPSRMPRPASPPCSPLLLAAPSPTQTPSLSPGPLPGPRIAAGSPPDGSAAPTQRASFAVTWQGPGEEEIHLYNKSANGFLAHECFIRYLSGILKVGLKQHGICQDTSSQPEQRKNSQGESEMPLLTVHAAGSMSGLMGLPHGCPFFSGRCRGLGPAICMPCGPLGLPPVSGSTPGWKWGGPGFLHVRELNWPGGHRVQ